MFFVAVYVLLYYRPNRINNLTSPVWPKSSIRQRSYKIYAIRSHAMFILLGIRRFSTQITTDLINDCVSDVKRQSKIPFLLFSLSKKCHIHLLLYHFCSRTNTADQTTILMAVIFNDSSQYLLLWKCI